MNWKKFKCLIQTDLYRYKGETNLRTFFFAFVMIEGFRYSFFLRLKNSLNKKNLIYWLIFLIVRHYGYKYGFQIFAKNIGKGFYIGHFGTIIINKDAILGNNVNISPGLVIGQSSRGKYKGVPTIGSNVWIGANAIIVGKITIGHNVLIAPGSYVSFDVPDNSIVKGNPASIFQGRGIEDYILNPWNE